MFNLSRYIMSVKTVSESHSADPKRWRAVLFKPFTYFELLYNENSLYSSVVLFARFSLASDVRYSGITCRHQSLKTDHLGGGSCYIPCLEKYGQSIFFPTERKRSSQTYKVLRIVLASYYGLAGFAVLPQLASNFPAYLGRAINCW